MRKRLLESAMLVFSQKGLTSSVIQDVVAAAEVSQGSFYNYFRTSEDLFQALAEELSNEIMRMIESVIGDLEDPALRVASAIRSYLHLMRSCPAVAQFVASAGLKLVNKDSAGYIFLPRDLKAAQKQGRFDVVDTDLTIDLIAGTGLMAIARMASGRTRKDYPEQVTALILRSLGVTAASANKLTAAPLPKLSAPEGSLFAPAQARSAIATAPKRIPRNAA
jgi:AcrR family transcriptional regulator